MKKILTKSNSAIIILERGEELIESLDMFAREEKLSGAWLSGLGAASDMTIGYYDLEAREYVWRDVDEGIVEVLGLTGNYSNIDGKPLWHIHGNFSGTDLKAFGGHIKKMRVGLTCEISITYLDTPLGRKYDDETGLNLIDPS